MYRFPAGRSPLAVVGDNVRHFKERRQLRCNRSLPAVVQEARHVINQLIARGHPGFRHLLNE